MSCCHDDCCGPGTRWFDDTKCVSNPEGFGFDGVHVPSYENAPCPTNFCCEEDCCNDSQGTIYDPVSGVCYGYPIDFPYVEVRWWFFPIPSPTVLEPPPEDQPAPTPAPTAIKCECPETTLTQEYSRGNNDLGEMITQFGKAKTGKYQYETGKFLLDIVVKSKTCQCTSGKCDGIKTVELKLKITGQGPGGLSSYVLLPGPTPSKATTVTNAANPGPSLDTTVDKVDLPAAKANNKFGMGDTATATDEIPCKVGTHLSRFYIAPASQAGKKGVEPGKDYRPIAYIDVTTVLTEQPVCKMTAKVDAFLLEFLFNYDFSHGGRCPGAPAELGDVKHNGIDTGTTDNIVKKVSENGKAIPGASAFPPQAP